MAFYYLADCLFFADIIRFTISLILLFVPPATLSTAESMVSGPHIADVNILLPPKMTHPVEYRLQGTDGCFKWSWDHHDILSVVPEYDESNHCSSSARLRSIAPYTGRKETAVYAADVITGIVIRCKVFIDIFSRIQIFHNSIKLDLDGLATLRVRGFDREENVFSSLVGLQFMWQLMPHGNGSLHHLVHVPLKDSPLSDCSGFCGDLDIQIKLEDSGMFSDLYVAKGIEIGQEVVSVHLLEPQYEHMEDEIILTVAEAMSLDPPSPVFVLVDAVVHYNLKVIRANIPQVVTLPSPFYRWSASNPSVVRVDAMAGVAHALSLGETSVIVEDTRVAGHEQTSSFHVVLPDFLCLYILPLSILGEPVEDVKALSSAARWYVISGRQYLIQTKVFSQGPVAHEIYITENDDLKLYYDQAEYWKIFPVSDAIRLKYGWGNSTGLNATSQGVGKLSASLAYSSEHPATKEVLKVMQEVMVCNPVKFRIGRKSTESSNIFLPWAPGIFQEVELKAVGGCAKTPSDYRWFSSDITTASVSAAGAVQARKPGKAIIKVGSVFDTLNFDEVVVEVSAPSSMVMLPNIPVETVVGSYLQAAVTMKASNGEYFYECDAFRSSIKWNTASELFVVVNSTAAVSLRDDLENVELSKSAGGPPCALAYIYAASPGRAVLQATLSREHQILDHPFDRPIILKASTPIASYSPLIVHQVSDGNQFGGYFFCSAKAEHHDQLEKLDELYLAPGTYLDVKLLGGPERWGEGVDFIESVYVLPKNGAVVHPVPSTNEFQYRIFCQALGSFTVVFKRGNLKGVDHPLPVVAEVELFLACSFPSSIVVLADEPVNALDIIKAAIQADAGPSVDRLIPITVENGRNIRIAAVGISNSGKAFANSSSLPLSWELNDCHELAYWVDDCNSELSTSSWERFLALQNASGLCTVQATVHKIADDADDSPFASLYDRSDSVLTDAIHLQLVSALRVSPEFSLLFFNPDAKMNLSIMGGSCFLDAAVNDSHVVKVIQPVLGLQCLQLILTPKGLGSALVTVYDIGFTPPLTAFSVVQVADLDWIKITSGEELSIMEGSSQSIELLAGINNGNTFDSSQYLYMDIRMHIEDNIVDIVNVDHFSNPGDVYINSSNFTIYGRQLGTTTLFLSARQQSGLEVVSQQIKVEVYAPPVVHPHDLFLVPGASYVLTLKGGPTIGTIVHYASVDYGTAAIHESTGQVSAISPGNTTVVATIYGRQQKVICKAYGKVKVGVPSMVTLNAQSQKLAIGHDMPIFPLFSEGDLFSFYELCNNYQWTTEDEKVLTFCAPEPLKGNNYEFPLFNKKVMSSCYMDQKEVGCINLLYGRSAGRTNISLTFYCDFISGSFSQSRSYSASMSIRVVSDPPLALGIPITWILPPHYMSTDLFPLSSESNSKSDTQTLRRVVTYSVLDDYSRMNNQAGPVTLEGSKIKTTDSDNLVCIQAKDHTTGRIEVASCVRVAEVAQIRIIRKPAFHLIDMAVGDELELPIHYYDDLGIQFLEANNVILFDAETNYRDIVAVNICNFGNGSIKIKAIRHGRALVRVRFDESPHKSDYVMISAGAYIYPQNPVLQPGTHLNLSIEGTGPDDQASGQWLSANESIISVDSPSGNAVAVGEGTTLVIFQSSSLTLQTTVTVLKGIIIFVDAPKGTLTNIALPTRGYNFSVKFSGHKFEPPSRNVEVPYNCRVDPPFIGYAKPWRDLDTGDSYCLFFPYSPEHLANSAPKSNNTRQDISVSIHASLRDANDVSGSASALFIGGFSILEMKKGSLQLNLTPESNRSIITIVGNTDVGIYWRDQDLLMISPVYQEDSGIGGFAQYEVKVLSTKPLKDKVVFTLPANGQTAEVDVNYEPGEETSGSTIDITLWAAVIVCFALLILTVVIFICFLNRPDRSRPPIVPATPSRSAPVTPDHRSSSVTNDHSPRTPQPFIEYVRRTIDETPYYRREGRRRFNPQNTY
ncbi:hypothetical protein Nepgr_016849 [Nepenthes gracilis]|uniref:BIG2 domain-containing protein n=1 Tax=Nepenthes gracilis TaxID=150966 RepID=A0AAD3SPB3_NEPGR|nr:hypothetical protein Nepgr_016849 [Nepenthes gracilis]